MRNFIKPGKVLTMVAPSGGVESGELVKIGLVIGVATTSADEGDAFELALGECYELPKTSAEAWTVGAAIYMTSAGVCTTTSTDNDKIGVAIEAAANPSGFGKVRLNDNF